MAGSVKNKRTKKPVIKIRPWGLTAWKVTRNGEQVGVIRKIPHTCHCAEFGKWKYLAYNMQNQLIGTNQYNLMNARNLFKTRF